MPLESPDKEELEPMEDPRTSLNYELNDVGLSRRRGRLLQRGISTTRQSVVSFLPSRTFGSSTMFTKTVDGNDGGFISLGYSQDLNLESQADEIVRQMASDQTLMDDNPVSEQNRIETLREMPENLTLKRNVKKKLHSSVHSKSKSRPISLPKRLKYQINMSFSKIKTSIKNVFCGFELWYNSLKTVSGHFGSGVATYFRFLRWLFIHNIIVFIISLCFVVIPQLLIRLVDVQKHDILESLELSNESTAVPETDSRVTLVVMKTDPYAVNDRFSFGNLLTGEGFLTETELYYGFYSNMSLKLVNGVSYDIPTAYFFSALVCYLFVFVTLSISMAVSYRKSFIQTSGGLKNIFAHKIFCGWDFGIATEQAAELKSRSIRMELKELLEGYLKDDKKDSCIEKVYTLIVQMSLNLLFLVLMAGIGYWVWQLLGQHISDTDAKYPEHASAMMMSLIVTIIIHFGPILFSWVVQFEDYKTPRSALYVTLLRTLALDCVVIGVLVAFWLNHSSNAECWETSLGQEVYRLVLMDFVFGLVGTPLAEFVRARIYLTMWKGIGYPEFDIARNTMNLIYNQTLFYVGFYFSPVLALIIIIKMFLTFYIKKYGAIYNCRPSSRSWRAAQTQTVFLAISFLTFLGVLITYGYILTSIKTSNCGPFRGHDFMYEKILNGILDLKKDSVVLYIILYLTKPGVVAIVLIAMFLTVYYLRAQALARKRVVDILREMLLLQAKDKEFLLKSITKVTENGDIPFNRDEIFQTEPSNTWRYESKQNINQDSESLSTQSSPVPPRIRSRFKSEQPLYFSTQNIDHSDSFASKRNRYGSAPHIDRWKSIDELNAKQSRAFASTAGLMEDLSEGGSYNEHGIREANDNPQNLAFQIDETQEDYDLFRRQVINFNPVYTESELDQHSPPLRRSTRPLEQHSPLPSRSDSQDDEVHQKTPFSPDDRFPSRIYFKNSKSNLQFK